MQPNLSKKYDNLVFIDFKTQFSGNSTCTLHRINVKKESLSRKGKTVHRDQALSILPGKYERDLVGLCPLSSGFLYFEPVLQQMQLRVIPPQLRQT